MFSECSALGVQRAFLPVHICKVPFCLYTFSHFLAVSDGDGDEVVVWRGVL